MADIDNQIIHWWRAYTLISLQNNWLCGGLRASIECLFPLSTTGYWSLNLDTSAPQRRFLRTWSLPPELSEMSMLSGARSTCATGDSTPHRPDLSRSSSSEHPGPGRRFYMSPASWDHMTRVMWPVSCDLSHEIYTCWFDAAWTLLWSSFEPTLSLSASCMHNSYLTLTFRLSLLYPSLALRFKSMIFLCLLFKYSTEPLQAYGKIFWW